MSVTPLLEEKLRAKISELIGLTNALFNAIDNLNHTMSRINILFGSYIRYI